MTTGEQVRDVRLRLGMTLEELGEKLGKSKQYMSELERGNIRLTYEMAAAIASACDVELGPTPDRIFVPRESKMLGHTARPKETPASG